MAHMVDMEELLATVSSSDVRDYMREAMSCYMANAYRGCIVLCFIALFDDLLDKLRELSKVNRAARRIYGDAKKKKEEQAVFESYLIDQLGSTNLLSGLDTDFLNILRDLRNKSAHPSGHKPSAEEARFIFSEVISRFLSQPILTTTKLVDMMIERLKNKYFFPTSQPLDIKEVVTEELKELHRAAYPLLVIKFTSEFTSSNVDIKRNAGLFLIGLAALDEAELNSVLQKKVIIGKSEDPEYTILILGLISSNGKLFSGLSKTCIKRIIKLYSERIDNIKASDSETQFSHPIRVFESLAHVLSDDDLVKTLSDEIQELFKKRPYSNYLISTLMNNNLPKIRAMYLEEIKKKAGSDKYDVTNDFASTVEDIDGDLGKLTSDKDAFEIVVALLKAANGEAFGAQWLRETKFTRIPSIKSRAVKYIKGNNREAKEYIQDKLLLDNMKMSGFLDKYFGFDGNV